MCEVLVLGFAVKVACFICSEKLKTSQTEIGIKYMKCANFFFGVVLFVLEMSGFKYFRVKDKKLSIYFNYIIIKVK